jgi:hypothetical protein
MSEDYLAQQPTAMWNPARGVWEKPTENLLCEHWELFSETWPTSGMTRDGQVFELPMRVRLMPGSESLLSPTLRTPSVIDSTGGAKNANEAESKGNHVKLQDQMATLAGENGLKVSSAISNNLLPTPNTMDHLPARTPEQKAANRGKGGYVNVRETVVNDLLPTPKALDGEKGNLKTSQERLDSGHQVDLPNVAIDLTPNISWGKFEPAIRRWENILGRPAPAPTKPDGKDGAHRLSSKFTEWMMGLPDGWITNCGLTRNEELKACGNGVVPQQAELALRHLLEGIPLPTGGGQVNLPTPTVSDTFTDNLSSTQQKDGSMHSVTLPQAVRMIP